MDKQITLKMLLKRMPNSSSRRDFLLSLSLFTNKFMKNSDREKCKVSGAEAILEYFEKNQSKCILQCHYNNEGNLVDFDLIAMG